MRADVRILVGLGMIGAGAAGLLAMNLWTLPTMAASPCPPAASCPPCVATSHAGITAPSAPAAFPSGAAGAPGETADAGSAADAVDGGEAGGGTSRAADGTTFPDIRFEERSRAPSRELMVAVQPLAAYLRGHFDQKVVLTGHGDAAMSAAEYVQTGRLRAGIVLRILVDNGVSVSRITVQEPTVEGDQVVSRGVAPGTVEASVEPRFESKKGDADVP